MKYYNTHYEEYIQSVKQYNIHPELKEIYDQFPKTIPEMGNIIVYGPCGSGKYSQVLYLLERYSPSRLKYDKHVTIHTEKQSYTYRISDIHYEVDMGLLGCYSKLLWHELFFQIVDIISMKTGKTGILVCKNFHMIHSELLDVFYSYMQHSKTISHNMCIQFILVTEHISFIPTNILNCCEKISVRKPSNADYLHIILPDKSLLRKKPHPETLANAAAPTQETIVESERNELFCKQISETKRYICEEEYERAKETINEMSEKSIINLKELHLITQTTRENLPKDIFNIICDNIIAEITNSHNLVFANFRENLYDILIYNLDVSECIWYILTHFIHIKAIRDTTEILPNIYTFLKYYNNNYRPIYHLESILFYLLLEFKKQTSSNESKNGV
jgi:hypothetical protein